MNKEGLISEIIRLELEIMRAIFEGHKAHDDDEFKLHRELLKIYRSLLYDTK